MAAIKFLYRFALGAYDLNNPGVNILSITSEANGEFGKVNLTTTPLREVWRSSSLLTQKIVIEANDLNTVVDTFAILNHNLTDLAVVTLKANTVNNFAVPAVTINFQWNKKHLLLLQDFGFIYRYWQITIVDPTNPCGYIQIGKIIAGRSLTFTQNEDITDDIGQKREDLAYSMKTEGFFRASNERVKVDVLSLSLQKIQTANGADPNFGPFMDMTEYVGITIPFLTITDPGDPYFLLRWTLFNEMPSPTYMLNRYANVSLILQEIY